MPPLNRLKKRSSVLDFNRKAMDAFGLWPMDPLTSTWGRRWRRFIPIFVLCRLAGVFTLQAMSIKHAWGDTYLAVESTIMLILYIHVSVKFVTLYWHRARVRRVFELIDRLNVDLVGVFRDNVAVLRDTDILCDRINKYPTGGVISLLIASSCFLIPYSLSKRQISFVVWLPHDITTSPSFEITMTVIFLGLLVDLASVALCDICVAIPILQLAGHLQMLRHDIEHAKLIVDHNFKLRSLRGCTGFPRVVKLQEGSTRRIAIATSLRRRDAVDKYLGRLLDKPSVEVGPEGLEFGPGNSEIKSDEPIGRLALMRDEEIATRMLIEMMRLNIGHHQQIIKLVQEIQSIFNALLAEQILFNGLLGLSGLYVSTLAKKTDSKVLMMISLIMGGLVEFFFICLCCDRLTVASMRVFDAAYESDWLEASESFKRSLRLLMTRAQKHLAIKAAGVPLSRRTFRAVCKGAYYLQSLLNKIYTRN